MLFEGEQEHLTPSTSKCILQSDLFVAAGHMIGHCFLNGGPYLTGLSPAIVHVLFGGEPETATIEVNDCVDQDVREIVQLVCFNFIFACLQLSDTMNLSAQQNSCLFRQM